MVASWSIHLRRLTWSARNHGWGGTVAEIRGYEVIVTNESVRDDIHDCSRPVLSAHVLPSVTSLRVPTEFLEPGTEYELEVIALEESGNQTIALVFFETQ